jgi:hypothetical protein
MKNKKEFRHHPDGVIYINGVSLPLEEFVKEYPGYSLPEGYIGREYVKGKFHRVYNSKSEKFLDKNWEEGNEYIKEEQKFKEKKVKLEKEKRLERESKLWEQVEQNYYNTLKRNKEVDERVAEQGKREKEARIERAKLEKSKGEE